MLPRAFQAIACCGSVSHPGPSITPPCQPGSAELDHPRRKHRWQGWQQEGYPDPERLGPPHQLPCGLRPPCDVTGEQPGRDVEHAVDMLFRGQDTADLISNHRVRMGRRHMGGRQASQQNCEGPRTAKRCPQQLPTRPEVSAHRAAYSPAPPMFREVRCGDGSRNPRTRSPAKRDTQRTQNLGCWSPTCPMPTPWNGCG